VPAILPVVVRYSLHPALPRIIEKTLLYLPMNCRCQVRDIEVCLSGRMSSFWSRMPAKELTLCNAILGTDARWDARVGDGCAHSVPVV